MSDDPTSSPVFPTLIGTSAAAARYGINANTFRGLVRRGETPPFYKIGGAIKFDLIELDAWFFSTRTGGGK
jgi:hypothetical protein